MMTCDKGAVKLLPYCLFTNFWNILIIPELFLSNHFRHLSNFGSDPEVIKLFMLNSAEHKISNAHKYKNMKFIIFFRLGYA